MANDIKQKIVLEGEKEYNRALADAKRNLKTLRSELKAETAELGANATAQQKNEARIKSLQKQIKEQEKVVKTYQAALAEVKSKYSDNEDAIAKWEQKLNDARTSLANMKNELDSVGDGFKNIQGSADMAAVSSHSVAEAFGKLSEVGGAISSGIEEAFKGVISTVKETITEVWGEITDLAARSNGLVDLAGYWNTDVLTIQKYKGAVAEASATLEDLNTIVTRINSQDSKKITELVGVSKENYKDEWEYAMAVMDKLAALDKNKRNEIGFDIFGGKGATRAFDLLNDWQTVLDHLDKYDTEKGGFGMSAEDLQLMSDLYDKVNGLKESWSQLKDMATVKLFGELSMNLTGNAQSIVDGFLKYFNAGSDQERNEALKAVEENILEMFETAKKAIEDGIKMLDEIAADLKASDNPTAQALGNLLSGLVDALQWLTEDNMKNVVKALEVLAAFWLAGKGLAMGTKIAEMVTNIKSIQAFNALSGVTGAGVGTGTTAAATGSWIGSLVKAVAPWLIGAGIVVNDSLNNHGDENQWTEEEIAEIARKNNFDGLEFYDPEEEKKQIEQQSELIEDLTDTVDMTQKQWDAAQAFWDAYRQDPDSVAAWEEAWDNFETAFAGNESAFDKLMEMIDDLEQNQNEDNVYGIEDLPAEWWRKTGGNSGETDGLTSADARSMTDAVGKMPAAVAKSVSGLRVYMDGATVGRIVAPYVSAAIATAIP